MVENYVISENIEVIVFGTQNAKFIEKIILNSGFKKSVMVQSLIKQNKEFLNTFLTEASNLSAKSCPSTQTSKINVINNDQNQLHTKSKNGRKTYFKNIGKLLNLSDFDQNEEKEKEEKIDNKTEFTQLTNLEKGISYLTWADFKRVTSTISTKNFWININFNLVSDMFLDPYINNFVTANINLLVITFDANVEEQINKMINLFKKLASLKPPSNIKYQSQMLLLQSGYYQAFNDNIVLALCELPEIEPIGPCFLASFGKDIRNNFNIDEEKTGSKIEFMENDNFECVIQFYSWLIKTHQKIKYSNTIQDDHMKEIINAIKKELANEKNKERNSCNVF